MPAPRHPRLPIAPLYAATGTNSLDSLALVLTSGVTDSTWNSIRRSLTLHPDGITERRADRYACALGLHPSLIWGDAWWALAVNTATPEEAKQLELLTA